MCPTPPTPKTASVEPGCGAALRHGVVGGDAGAEQRGGLDVVDRVGHRMGVGRGGQHVLGVPAVRRSRP